MKQGWPNLRLGPYGFIWCDQCVIKIYPAPLDFLAPRTGSPAAFINIRRPLRLAPDSLCSDRKGPAESEKEWPTKTNNGRERCPSQSRKKNTTILDNRFKSQTAEVKPQLR
jgi:hypothetical protein